MWRLGEPTEFNQHFYNRHIEETKLIKMQRETGRMVAETNIERKKNRIYKEKGIQTEKSEITRNEGVKNKPGIK